MFSKNLKIIIFALFCLIFILGPNFVLAQRLEIQYPPVPFPGVETPNVFMQKIHDEEPGYAPEQALPLYVKYFYYLLLTITGLVAFGAIVYGGFQYLISFGAPVKMIAAKDQILGGILGLVILLSSYLILTTIDPRLTVFSLSGLREAELPEIATTTEATTTLPTFFQVPTGQIIENAIINDIGQAKMTQVKTAAEETRQKAEILKNLTENLKNETDKCKCYTSQCSGPDACTGIGCPNAFCDEGKINQIIVQINQAIEELKESQSEVFAARVTLTDDYLQLRKAGLLTSLPPGVIDYNGLLMRRCFEEVQTETLPGWEDINIQLNFGGQWVVDPATFYFYKWGNEDAIELAKLLNTGVESFCWEGVPNGNGGPPSDDTPPDSPMFPWGSPICTSINYAFADPNYLSHKGIDFRTGSPGMPIHVTADGRVRSTGIRDGYGLHVEINHGEVDGNTYFTIYGHFIEVIVTPGDSVERGDVLGYSGGLRSCGHDWNCYSASDQSAMAGFSSGYHLHYEVRKNGTQQNINSGYGICAGECERGDAAINCAE